MDKIILNKKYKPLFKNESRFFLITGGRASAKSFSVAYWAMLLIYFESDHVILYTRYTMKTASQSIIEEFKQKISMWNLQDAFIITKDEIECIKTGSKILFRGIKTSSGDQTANLKSLTSVTTWICDEAEELADEATFDKIELSIRSNLKQNRIIIILNPATKTHWIYNKFYQNRGINGGENIVKEDTTYIHTTYIDNKKNLPEDYIKNLERERDSNPDKFNHVVLGGWLEVAEGVIFTNWEYGEFSTDVDTIIYGQDFGFHPDPDVLVKVGIDKKNHKIYIDELIYENKLETPDLIAKMKENMKGNMNGLIIADCNSNRLISEIKNAGFNIKGAVKGAGSVEEGIKLLSDYKFILTERSVNVAKELNNYVWSNKKGGIPRDMYNHSMDSIRYGVTYYLKPKGKFSYSFI